MPELAFYLVILEYHQKPMPPLWDWNQWESDYLDVSHHSGVKVSYFIPLMWLSYFLIFCFFFQSSSSSLPVMHWLLLSQDFPVQKERSGLTQPVTIIAFEKNFSCQTTSLATGLLPYSVVQCGRYWMICLLEELFNSLAIIYWPTLGRNIFSLSSFWESKSKRNT